jgi:predicted nucleic acid-binding Zn ribbon protein
MKKRTCPNCNDPLKGRPDKKYCSPECRAADHYEKRKQNEKLFFQVDAKLKTNRRVLKKYNTNGKTILRREVLHKEGFDPNYFTHFRKTVTGDVYFYCYDFGFLKMKETTPTEMKQKYLIINWNGK